MSRHVYHIDGSVSECHFIASLQVSAKRHGRFVRLKPEHSALLFQTCQQKLVGFRSLWLNAESTLYKSVTKYMVQM